MAQTKIFGLQRTPVATYIPCLPSAVALGLTFGLATSCQVNETDSPPTQTLAQNLGAQMVDPDHATAPEVIIGWKGVPYGSSRPSSTLMTATITNPSAVAKKGRLTMVASGLNGRLVERDVGEFFVKGNHSAEVSVAADAIPLQSEIAISFVVLQTEIDRGDGVTVRTGTQPLYYRFEDNYKTVVLHHVDDVAALPNGGNIGPDTMDVRGRLLDSNQQWSDASVTSSAGYKLGLTGVRAVAAGADDPAPITVASQSTQTPGPLLSASMRICSTWRVQYVDSGFGEDGLPLNVWQDAPASLASAFILSVPGNAVYWHGSLDINGCTPAGIALPAGTFRLQQKTTYIGIGGIYINNYYMSGGVPYEYQVWADFMSTGSGSSTITVHPTFNNDAIQAAAIASREIAWHGLTALFGSGGLGFLPGTYTIHANEGCPGVVPPTDSCYDPQANLVHLGTTVVGGYSDAHWKYVIAHETGHLVQDRAMGHPYYSYGDVATESLCKCDHYSTEWGNQAHCLQSREGSGGAQMEGFGHAFASRVFNNPFDANGTFVYYKPFLNPNMTVSYPPLGRSAFGIQDWMENHCLASWRGVEWDWLTFYYNVSSNDRSNATKLPDLFDIYKLACTGSTSTKCNGQYVHWNTLQQNAGAYFGLNDPRYARFNQTGQDFGVDH